MSISPGVYAEYFRAATTFDPYPYQQRLAERAPDFLKVETGLGKTEALVLGWDWRRRHDAATPRRLIYTLPMRSLVEQTVTRLKACRERLARAGINDFPQVDTVMGGDIGEFWFREPETPAIVVGTQDMLLSRALNRGYGMSRFRWPMTFGAINNDVYWVIDEVQLQGIGAVTAAQIQAFRDRLGCFGTSVTTFASATLDTSWLETAEYVTSGRLMERLGAEDLSIGRVDAILNAPKHLERLPADREDAIAHALLENHRRGTLTLAVLNTVRSAKDVYRRIARSAGDAECRLLHSQFRLEDRNAHSEALTSEVDGDGAGRIVIATQVVEAGIDVSATTLITDVAPWSSLVQRFGRCNRRGKNLNARVLWIDRGEPSERTSAPYDVGEMQVGRSILIELTGHDVAPSNLHDRPIKRGNGLVLRSPELLDLFDTSSDLSGHDLDVSAFIREAEEFNVSVFWRAEPPGPRDPPRREELCPAPVGAVRDAVKELRAAGRGTYIRIANQFGRSSKSDAHERSEEWSPLVEGAIRPGLQVWMRMDAGWYDPDLGFERGSRRVDPVNSARPGQAFQDECDTIDGDNGSEIGVGVTITQHAQDTLGEAKRLLEGVAIARDVATSVERAALWHDVGKAHEVFQKTMRANMPDCPAGLWAKSPRGRGRHDRKGFRHELPGALAYLGAHEGEETVDLIAFLIAAHHGKLRMSAPSLPYDALGKSIRVLGNENGDRIPSVDLLDGERSPEFTLELDSFRVASSDDAPTWVERSAALRDSPDYGPFRLAYCELLVRLADWRASEKATKQRDE
ncbi:MAG: type I-G CRISPR-associated helicase/endonuclease Cas3g [Vulcanimicrobiaceae bacterium]